MPRESGTQGRLRPNNDRVQSQLCLVGDFTCQFLCLKGKCFPLSVSSSCFGAEAAEDVLVWNSSESLPHPGPILEPDWSCQLGTGLAPYSGLQSTWYPPKTWGKERCLLPNKCDFAKPEKFWDCMSI